MRAVQADLFEAVAEGLPARARVFANGLIHVPAYLDPQAQHALLLEIETALAAAPLFQPLMPKTGKAFSVRMSNCGALGWVSDRAGYRYQAAHPETCKPWPKIPALALAAWRDLAAYPLMPEACLINYYDVSARMGLHQDRGEADLAAPVLSLSLGSSCIFRVGGTVRGGKTMGLELASGDAVVLAGGARLAYHGVARILSGTSSLLPGDGRINLTLRRVTRPSPSL